MLRLLPRLADETTPARTTRAKPEGHERVSLELPVGWDALPGTASPNRRPAPVRWRRWAMPGLRPPWIWRCNSAAFPAGRRGRLAAAAKGGCCPVRLVISEALRLKASTKASKALMPTEMTVTTTAGTRWVPMRMKMVPMPKMMADDAARTRAKTNLTYMSRISVDQPKSRAPSPSAV